MEITINRKTLGIAVTVLIIAGLAAWLFAFGGLSLITSYFTLATSSPPTSDPDAQAAALGVSALYTISTTDGVDAWLEHVCSVSTEVGCAFAGNVYEPAISKIAQIDVEAVAEAQPLQRMEGDGISSIWELTLTIDQPWEGIENPQTVYALVHLEDDRWLFERVLFQQEVQARYIDPERNNP